MVFSNRKLGGVVSYKAGAGGFQTQLLLSLLPTGQLSLRNLHFHRNSDTQTFKKRSTYNCHDLLRMAFRKCHHAEDTSPRHEKIKRLQSKARSQAVAYDQAWYVLHFNPDRDFYGKAKKNLIQRRKKKRESSDEVDRLGQTSPRDDELV